MPLSNLIKNFVTNCFYGTGKFLIRNSITRIGTDQLLKASMDTVVPVEHGSVRLKLTAPNNLNQYRARTFSTKEPETLEWIDSLQDNSVLWDIGANVGLYSCYAAKSRNCRVFAFEPSVFNLELLARNIHLNDLVSFVTIIPLPLSNENQVSTLNMTGTDWGGALSTFGESYGDDGKPLKKIFEFSSQGVSMDFCLTSLNVPQPDHIKMDVDGLEHLILNGGKTVLEKTKSIILEVNEDFERQASSVHSQLTQAGFQLTEKRRAELFSNSPRFKNTYNQIWEKN